MNLKDHARLINECNLDVEQTIFDVTINLPQRRTRLMEGLIALKDILPEEQVKEMKFALSLINNTIKFKEEEEVKPLVVAGVVFEEPILSEK